jgi:hypothetical protein
MLTISIYRGDQRSKAHAAFGGDLPQTVPELVFKTDAGLVVCNSNRALRRTLRNRDVRGSLPQMYHRYYAFLDRGERGMEGAAPATAAPGSGAARVGPGLSQTA